MSKHFTSFTSEAMRAFGRELADSARTRAEFRASLREQVAVMMERLRRDAREAEQIRREHLAREAEARQRFVSELRASVHALLHRFELGRAQRAEALQAMASECRAACQAFRDRGARAERSDPPEAQDTPVTEG